MEGNQTSAVHSGERPPDATRQGQYDALAKADSIEAIVQTEIGQEAMRSPVFKKYLETVANLAKK